MLFMKKIHLFFCLVLTACSPSNQPTASQIIDKSVSTYGWDQEAFSISFDFRDYHYDLIRKPSFYSYQRLTEKEGILIRDVMTSKAKLKRYQDDEQIVLKDSLQEVYSNALNAVMYFFQLPKPLKDGAVISELLGTTNIAEKAYWTLKISFTEQGGGSDFQDEYRYWIDKENYQIAYLAYNYLTDGGGTRFRSAKNIRKQKGFIFQDYINYRPKAKFISLDSLPLLFEQKKLIEVSQIENKNIQILKR